MVDPGWPVYEFWPQQCITLWSGVFLNKFGGLRALLSKLAPTWPRLTPTWPSTPAMHWILPTKFGGHRTLLSKLTPADPYMIFDPGNALCFGQGFFPPILVVISVGISEQFDHRFTPDDPCMTFDPSNALRSGQGFSSPNLVAIGHF